MIQKQNSFYINLHCFEFICIHMRPSLSVFIFDINIMMCPLSFLLFREINWKAIFGKLTMPSSSRAGYYARHGIYSKVEGSWRCWRGRPPHQAPIWQEHPIRSDLEKLQHKHLAETLDIVECWNAFLEDQLLYCNVNIDINTGIKFKDNMEIQQTQGQTSSVNSKVDVCRC